MKNHLSIIAFALGFVTSGLARAQVDPRADAYYLYCLGRMYEMQGQSEASLSQYRDAIEKDPEAAYLHLAIAELHAKSDRVEEAMASAQTALDLDSDLAGAHRLLGKIYFSMFRAQNDSARLDQSVEEFQETVRLEPWDVETRQRLAELHLGRGEIEKAGVQLEALIKQAPDAYYAMYRLGQIRAESGDFRGAAELYRQAIETEPRHQASRLELGRVYSELGDYEKSEKVYRDALELAPEDGRIRVRLAYTLAAGGDLDEAARQFERVLENEPEYLEALLGLARVRQGLKELDVAEALFEKALELKPDLIQAREYLAGVFQEKREYDEASRVLESLLAMPEDAYPSTQRAQLWAQLGFVRQELGNHDGAVEALGKAKALSAEDPRYEAAFVQVLFLADRVDEAEKAYLEAIRRFPESDSLNVLGAQIAYEQGRKQESLKKLLGMARLKPGNPTLTGAVVDLYQREKRFGDGEVFLLEVMEKTAESESLLFQLGAMLERQKKYDEAEEAFKKVLEMNPGNSAAMNYLGYMLAEKGVRLEESLDYIQRAVALDPYNGAYLDSLGWVYFKLDKLDLAEENIVKAIGRLRTTGVVYDHLGDVYYRKGKREDAIRSWRKALEQDDDELEADEVKRKIDRALGR
jgi:tetratricopeptide (TPR) repeat protein